MTSQPFLFITGTQRSGTTLTCRILDAHPDVTVANEVLTPHELDGLLSGENMPPLRQELEKRGVRLGTGRGGIKHPYFTYHLENVSRLFPNAKIVIILRDGRAVANSYLKVRWGTANIYAGAKQWAREVRLQRAFLAANPDRAILVRYEDLVAEPRETLLRICRFLDLPFSEEMLSYHKRPPSFRRHRFNVNTTRGIDPSIGEKWKHDLTPRQIRIFESLAGDVLVENGYTLTSKDRIRIPPVLRLLYEAQQIIVGELQIQYKWRLKSRK